MNVETLLMLVTPSCQVLDLKKFSFDVTLIFSRVHKKTMFQKTKYWVRLMGSKEVEHPGERCTLYCLLREQGPLTISNVWFTVFPHIVAAATILFWIHLVRKLFKFSFPLCNEIWIVSSLDEETIQGEETIQFSDSKNPFLMADWFISFFLFNLFFQMSKN